MEWSIGSSLRILTFYIISILTFYYIHIKCDSLTKYERKSFFSYLCLRVVETYNQICQYSNNDDGIFRFCFWDKMSRYK